MPRSRRPFFAEPKLARPNCRSSAKSLPLKSIPSTITAAQPTTSARWSKFWYGGPPRKRYNARSLRGRKILHIEEKFLAHKLNASINEGSLLRKVQRMPTSFLPYEPNQDFLLPPSVSEWLPENHLAYFISETIDRLDLEKFYARYEGDGRRNQPYSPAMLAKVLVYGYATGVFSSRKLARKLYEDIAFRFLAAGNFPSHRTICDF